MDASNKERKNNNYGKHKRKVSRIHLDESDSSDDESEEKPLTLRGVSKAFSQFLLSQGAKDAEPSINQNKKENIEILKEKKEFCGKSSTFSESKKGSDSENDDNMSFIEPDDTLEESWTKIHVQESAGMFDNTIKFISLWFFRFLKNLFYVGLVLVPGSYCEFVEHKPCDFLFGTKLIRYCLMLAVIIFSSFVADLAVVIIYVIIKNTPVLGTQFLYYVVKIQSPLKWTIIATTIHLTWLIVFRDTALIDPNGKYVVVYNNILYLTQCLLVTAISFLVKAIFMRFAAIRYHRSSYYNRIRRNLFNEYILCSLVEGLLGRKSEAKNRNLFIKLGMLGKKSLSSRDAHNLLSYQDTVVDMKYDNYYQNKGKSWLCFGERKKERYIFRKIPVTEEELLGKVKISNHKLAGYVEFLKNDEFNLNSGMFMEFIYLNSEKHHLEVHTDMNNIQAVRSLSRIIFLEIRDKNHEFVLKEDFSKYMRKDIADSAFQSFEGSWDGFLDESQFFNTLNEILKDRKALKCALNDAEKAINKLDHFGTIFLMFLLVLVYFLIFQVDPNKILVSLSSVLVASAFAVGKSVQSVFECIVFLFVTHPFDIGDRVLISTGKAAPVLYTVSKLHILNTELRRFDNTVHYFDNSQLMTHKIQNLKRSPDMIDIIELHIKYETSLKKLKMFEELLGSYLTSRTKDFYKKFEIEYKGVTDNNLLTVRLWIQHRSNFSNMKRYRERRNRIMLKLNKILKKLDIIYETVPDTFILHSGPKKKE